MKEITITKREEGQRFDRFLGKYLPGASSGFLHKMLRKKNIKLNGKKAEGREKLSAGDLIQIFFSDETFEKFQKPQEGGKQDAFTDGKSMVQRTPGKQIERTKQKKRLTKEEMNLCEQVKVLYSSEDILVFHKPAGMLSQRAKADDDSLNDYLIDYCIKNGIISREELAAFRPSVANRLDRNTSGIVLAGISIRGLQTLSTMLRERTLGKYYLCIVKGMVDKRALIKGYLYKDNKTNKVTISKVETKDSLPIETEYIPVCSNGNVTLLKIHLLTGRSHQIRAHLASIGHPLIGDYKYGSKQINDTFNRQFKVKDQMLHSYELDIPDMDIHIYAAIPDSFKNVMKGEQLCRPGIQGDLEALH